MQGLSIILRLILLIVAIVGLFICGLNIINFIFSKGGSYSMALSGFLMSTIGWLLASIKIDSAN